MPDMSKEELLGEVRGLKSAVTQLKNDVAGFSSSERDERMAKMESGLEDVIENLQELQREGQRTVVVAESDVVRAYTMPAKLRPASAPARAFVGDVQMQGYHDTIGGMSTFVPGLLDDPDARSDWQRDAQALKDEWCIARTLANRDQRARVDDIYRDRLGRVLAGRMFSDSATIGAEFIPELTLTSIEREARIARRVAARFRRQPISSSSNLLPFSTNTLQPYKYSSIGSDENPAKYTPSTMTTAERTIAPVGWAVRAQVDEDAAADSIVDVAAWLRMMMVEAIVDGEEDAIINGDTAGTHYHTGLSGMTFGGRWPSRGSSSDHAKSWIGLMARADDVSATVDNSSAQTAAGFLNILREMDEEHVFGEGVFAICNTKTLLSVMAYDEVETVDKFGPGAAIQGGAPASLYGVPLVPSKFMSRELNTSGVYDNSTKTKTAIAVCDPSRFVIYERSGQRVEQDRDIERGTSVFVAKVREQFKTIDGSSVANCALGYGYNQ